MNSVMVPRKKVVFIFHNSGLTGASLVLFRYIQFLSDLNKYEISILLPGKGKIEGSLQGMGRVVYFGSSSTLESLFIRGLKKFGLMKTEVKHNRDRVLEFVVNEKPDLVYFNTVACTDFVKHIKQNTNIPIVWHIHELELGVRLTGADPSDVITQVNLVVANSETTAKFLSKEYSVASDKMQVHFPVIPITTSKKRKNAEGKFVIGSSGTALAHKGALLFVQLAASVNRKYPQNNMLFKWVGNNKALQIEIDSEIRIASLEDKVIFTGEIDDPLEAYSEFDLFVSLSKEESFGLACMEVAAIGIPVNGFEGAGAIEELVRNCDGLLVPSFDIETMADSIYEVSGNQERLEQMGHKAMEYSSNFVPIKVIPKWIESIDRVLNGGRN